MSILCIEQYSNPIPADIQRAILRAGGLNRFGDPNYRLTWGWQALELRGGEHTDYDEHGDPIRREMRYSLWPRYAPKNSRFHLEVWAPPEFYGSPEEWRASTRKYIRGEMVDQLGDYPSRGDYELLATMESPSGGFVYPTRAAVEDMIKLHQRMRGRTRGEIGAAIDAELDYKKRERARKYHDILDSEKVAFPWKTWVPVTGANPRQLYS